MTYTLFMRPVRANDFEALMTLARETGPGFTSLPEDEGLMQAKIEISLKSFAGQCDSPQHAKYFMLAECAETGEIAGCSAVKAAVGEDQPFFNYRVITLTQSSPSVDRLFDMKALILTHEFAGCTEVGSLFLRAPFRGGGNGRLLAQSRYLLIAAQPGLFGDTILAELRGVIDEFGYSPFWEALTQRFFRMDYDEADRLSAISHNQFITDLMPKLPIYVDLLPKEAQAVIGRCHPDGEGAFNMLEWEGLRFRNVIDIFEGGPMVSGSRDQIRTIRESRLCSVQPAAAKTLNKVKCLVARDSIKDFRSTLTEAHIDQDIVYLDQATCDRLELGAGESLRVWAKT